MKKDSILGIVNNCTHFLVADYFNIMKQKQFKGTRSVFVYYNVRVSSLLL